MDHETGSPWCLDSDRTDSSCLYNAVGNPSLSLIFIFLCVSLVLRQAPFKPWRGGYQKFQTSFYQFSMPRENRVSFQRLPCKLLRFNLTGLTWATCPGMDQSERPGGWNSISGQAWITLPLVKLGAFSTWWLRLRLEEMTCLEKH